MTRLSARRDEGAALVTVILLAVVLMGLTATLAVVTQRGTASARSDVAGTSALGQGEAGIAQAVEYLRSSHAISAVNACASGSTCTSPYATPTGVTVTTDVAAARRYQVRISVVTPLRPPHSRVGRYRITSTGTSTAEGLRTVEVEVAVRLQPFPFGVYTAQSLSQGGGLTASNISIFTGACVNKRFQIKLSGTDLYYGGAPAAHAAKYITESNNACSPKDTQNVHKSGAACHSSYPGDQSAAGGPVSAPCNPVGAQSPAGSCSFTGAATSAFSESDLACYNPNPRGLPQSTYDELKRTAQLSGTYFTSSSYSLPASMPAQGVVFFDLANASGKTVSLNTITGYETSQCQPSGTRSVIIVVQGGGATINAGASIVGSLFVPDGNVKFNGAATIIGTIFAQNIDKGAGNGSISLQDCYLDSLPFALLDVRTLSYRELDR